MSRMRSQPRIRRSTSRATTTSPSGTHRASTSRREARSSSLRSEAPRRSSRTASRSRSASSWAGRLGARSEHLEPRAAARARSPRPWGPRDRLGHDVVRKRPAGAHAPPRLAQVAAALDRPRQLTCLSAPGTVEETLTPMAVRGGKKLVVVPISNTYAYAVEVRKRIGYDKNACEEGVLVYASTRRVGSTRTRSCSRGRRAAATSHRELFAQEGCTKTST